MRRDKAHCLNRSSALVWRHCDGQTTVEEMAALLGKHLDIPADQDIVWLALTRLGQAHLLQEQVTPPTVSRGYTRRGVLIKMGPIGAAVLVPTVISIVAPNAAQAGTCINANACAQKPDGTPCSPPACTNI